MKVRDTLRRSLTIAVPQMSKETTVEFLWELVSCWLLAVGTAMLQNVQLAYPISSWAILWQTALAVAVLALFSRRWFILLITSIQILLLGLLALVFFRIPIGTVFTAIGDFLVWWFAGMPEDSPLFTEAGLMAVHVLLNIGISLLMFFVVRLSRSAVPPMVLCGAILVTVMALGNTENNVIAVAAYLAGGFPLVARDHYSGRRLFSGEEKFLPLGNRWGLVTAAGVACILTSGVLLLTLPQDTTDLRTRWCSRVTADFQTLTRWFTTEQKETDKLTLRDLGLQSYETRIGGNLELIESDVLAVTDGTENQLLRVTSFDTYSGLGWKNSFDTAYRVNGPWKKTQRQMLSGNVLENTGMTERLNTLVEKRELTITLLQESTFLPTTGQITKYTENTTTKNPVVYNQKGELLSFFGLPAEYSYTVNSLYYPMTDDPYTASFPILWTLSETGEDAFYEDEEALVPYLALPDIYPGEAVEAAYKVSADCDDPFQKAVLISQYFNAGRGYKYTDKPGDMRIGEDVVTKLFNTKKGHSVYYATAVSTMIRSVGIPTRLVAGYRTVWSDAYGAYVVDKAHPYAWVECYIRRLGWISLDPTPRQQSNNTSTALQEIPQEQEVPLIDEDDLMDNEETDDYLMKVKRLALWFVPVLLLLLLAARSLLVERAYRPEIARKLFPGRRRRMHFYYRDVLRQLDRLDQPFRLHETLLEWLSRLEEPLGAEETARLRQALLPALAMLYGRAVPTEEDIAHLAEARRLLEERLQKKLPLPLYILHRRVLLPVLTPALLHCRDTAETTTPRDKERN